MKIRLWWACIPLFSWCRRQICYHFPTKFKPQPRAKDRCFDQCIWTAEAPCFGWSEWPCTVHGQSAVWFFFVGFVAELKVNSWSEATLQQLFQDWFVSDVNFNFSCFVHSHEFCFLQVWCHTVFASSRHRVLLKLVPCTLRPMRCSKNVQHCYSSQYESISSVLFCFVFLVFFIYLFWCKSTDFSCSSVEVISKFNTFIFFRFIREKGRNERQI